jgi:abortive infection bacteriophage resistance protein
MQNDFTSHKLKPNTYFKVIIDRYNFDRSLRLILFDAIKRIEIALRTKLIFHLSIAYESLWFL